MDRVSLLLLILITLVLSLFTIWFLIVSLQSIAMPNAENIQVLRVALSVDEKKALLAPVENEHVLNPGNPVSLVVYSDTDCIFCERYHKTLLQIAEAYPDTVSVTFRYSLLPIFPRSLDEAILLECVSRESQSIDSFLDFQFDLFTIDSSKNYSEEKLMSAATKYVDQGAASLCLNNQQARDFVLQSHESGRRIGVGTVPHTFIFSENSEVLELVRVRSFSDLEEFIQFVNVETGT